MAFSDLGSLGATGSSGNNQASLILTTTATAAAGSLVVVVVGDDNRLATADADGTEVSTVADSAGNNYQKAHGWSNNNAAAQAGAGVSLWWCVLPTQLASGGTITATFNNATLSDASGLTARNFSVTGSVSVEGFTQDVGDAADPAALDLTTTNIECLRIRGIAGEVGNNTSLTATDGTWTVWANGNSATTGTTAEICARAEHKISTGTGGSSNPTWVACDYASVYVAFKETAIAIGPIGRARRNFSDNGGAGAWVINQHT